MYGTQQRKNPAASLFLQSQDQCFHIMSQNTKRDKKRLYRVVVKAALQCFMIGVSEKIRSRMVQNPLRACLVAAGAFVSDSYVQRALFAMYELPHRNQPIRKSDLLSKTPCVP